MRLPVLWSVLTTLALLPDAVFASVLAIDYGTDYIKASLMKPGVPFDVLLNKDSKRKIQSSVGWKKADRLFGQDAFNLASRFPSDSFSSIKLLQAAPFDSDATSFYTSISSAEIFETARKTVGFRRSDGTEWTTEELVAMQFAYVKELAESLAGEKVYDVIVTVPPFYTQFERDAVADAIEIANLRTLALINDGTAVAVNYAMTRTFPKEETHIIYDAGASAIRATVVSFKTPDEKKSTKITVHGVGYDRKVGGAELDRRLREILLDSFKAKHKKDLRSEKKAMAKLWKETGRVKAILSANADATATIESLAYDIDFKSKVSRSTFEDKCADLKPRYTQPIFDALENAGLDLSNITSVILTGGSTRTPMIQAAVKAAVGEDKVAVNVNADEAAVLGAAFHGAGLSHQFKTKIIKVQDITAHDVQITYPAAGNTALSRPRAITTVIFPKGSKVGNKKTLTFKRKEDFKVQVDYKSQPAPGFPVSLLEAEIVGVAEALANLTEAGAAEPVVKATLTLSESGFVSITDAHVFGEIKDESLTGKLKGLFSGSGSTSAETVEETAENTPPRDTESSSSAEPTPTSSSSEKPAPTKPAVPKESTISLNLTITYPSLAPLSADDKIASRTRLRAIDQLEAAKNRKEEARNSLETYLYKIRDLLDDASEDSPFRKCSQESERKAIGQKVEELMAWVGEDGEGADTAVLLDKRNSLEVLERPIVHRYKEIEAFPQALNNSQMWNWSTRLFLTEAHQNLTAEEEAGLPSKWTKTELEGLEKTLKDHERWLNEWVEKQKAVKMNEDPVIDTVEMRARAKTLESHLQRLVKRKIPKAKKVKKPKAEEVEKVEEAPKPTEPSEPEVKEQIVEEEGQVPPPPTEGAKPGIHDEL